MARHTQIVRVGGVYWLCDGCGRGGVIPAGPFAAQVREKEGIAAPEPLIICFPTCHAHKDHA